MIARFLAVLALVALGIVFVGCASTDGPSSPSDANPPPDQAAPITGGALYNMN